MSFAEEYERKSPDETRQRTGADYVKFTEDYRVTLRILEDHPRVVFKHFIPAANKGRGLSAVCPNTDAQTRVCPIEAAVAHYPKDSKEKKDAWARRKYIVNVLDRTPYTTCSACGTFTPGTKCQSCGASLKGHDFAPLNKVKVLESGPMLFVQSLNPIEKMLKEDQGKDITEYDITFTASGTGRDKKVNALPRDPAPLEADALIDKETGEKQKLQNLDTLTEPNTVEEIELMLAGAPVEEIFASRDSGKTTTSKDDLPFD